MKIISFRPAPDFILRPGALLRVPVRDLSSPSRLRAFLSSPSTFSPVRFLRCDSSSFNGKMPKFISVVLGGGTGELKIRLVEMFCPELLRSLLPVVVPATLCLCYKVMSLLKKNLLCLLGTYARCIVGSEPGVAVWRLPV